jgi:hypothetical protein
MDRNSPANYTEATADGLRDVEAFIDYVHATGPQPAGDELAGDDADLVTPAIIPRCAVVGRVRR